MARKKDYISLGELIFLIGIFVVIAFFLIKWIVIGVVFAISAICIFIANIYVKNKRKKVINNIVDKNFEDSIIKPTEKISIKELKEKLRLFDIDIYNNLFEQKIIPRGQKYFEDKRIKQFNCNENKYSCIVKGREDYKVSITFDKNDLNKITNLNCSCPYHNDKEKNCKHIYALLLKIKCEDNLPIILKTITNFGKSVGKMIEDEVKYINKKGTLNVTQGELDDFKIYLQQYENKFNYISKKLDNYKYNEVALLNTLQYLVESSYEFNQRFKKFIINEGKIKYLTDKFSHDKENNTANALPEMVIADEIEKTLKKKNSKSVDQKLEKEMDHYELEEWQKDLVRKRRISPMEL